MATYIKKIATTPTRGNGFIVDSFNTTDNPSYNAPSLRAVEERTDNNLLFGGNFTSSFQKQRPADASNCHGWFTTKTSTGGNCYFAETNGYYFNPGFKGYLTSPNFISKDGMSGKPQIENMRFSLTVVYSVANSSDFLTATLENIPLMPVIEDLDPIIDTNDILVTLRAFHHNVYLAIEVNGSDNLIIRNIKLELGATATPVTWLSKDPGIMQAEQSVAKGLLGGDNAYIFTVEGTFTTGSDGHASIQLDVPLDCTQNNTTVLSYGVIDGYDNLIFSENNEEYSVSRTSILIDSSSNFYLRYLGTNAADMSATLSYRVTFLKFK